jgi:hypothetical protein
MNTTPIDVDALVATAHPMVHDMLKRTRRYDELAGRGDNEAREIKRYIARVLETDFAVPYGDYLTAWASDRTLTMEAWFLGVYASAAAAESA